jgi:hypothetical protein
MNDKRKATNKTPAPAPAAPVRARRPRTEDPGLDAVPRWLAPFVFLVVTIIFHREFVFADGKLLGADTVALSYFARNFYTNFIHAFHTFPLWNPLLYGGMPFIDGMHGDIFYPPSLAMFFLDAEHMWGWKILLHVFLAGVFCYLWLRELGRSRGASLIGGLVFMLGADLISLVFPGGDGKLFVSALAPLAFLLTARAIRLGRPRDYAAFSLGLALVMFTSHMQAAYFLVWGVTLYFFFRLFMEFRAGVKPRALMMHAAAFALAGVMGVGAAAIQFLPPLDYLRNWSHRANRTEQASPAAAYAYSTSYSLHPEELMSLVVPEFVGDNVQTLSDRRTGLTYWGRNGIKYNSEYAGLLGLLLLPLLFVRKRRGHPMFFAGLGALVLLYALGADTPFFRLFYLIPGVQLFRAPSIIIFLYGLSVATLAAFALDRAAEFASGERDEQRRPRLALWSVVAVLGVLAVLATTGILTSVWLSLFYPDISGAQANALQNHLGTIISGFWLTFATALVIMIAIEGWWRGIWRARVALVAIALISVLDATRAGRYFVVGTVLMNAQGDETTFEPDETISFLRGRRDAGEVFRVLDLSSVYQFSQRGYPLNVMAVHGLEQLAGHHGNEMGRYRQLIGGDKPARLAESMSLLDVTNTVYITAPALLEMQGMTEVFRGSRSAVYRNDYALPRAYLVGKVDVVPDDSAVNHLLAQGYDLKGTAVLPEPLPAGVTIQPDPKGSVQWVQREPNTQKLTVTTDKPALLMVLDNYYHAWRASVDGNAVPILRANYVFRAIPVQPGTHEVTFRYDTGYLKAPALISAVILIALMVVAFGGTLRERFRRKPA